MHRIITTCLLLAASNAFAVDPQALTFRDPPRVANGTLTFALDGPADVEVAILDSSNKIIRHLAAGVLGGKNPPPAPLQAGLAQKLHWDGKDDDGVKAQNGPFSFRVRAGTQAVFGKTLGGSPYTGAAGNMPGRAPVNGLVTDDQGRLYVLMMSAVGSHGNSGMWPWHLRQFDADGNYLKTILPYPPSTKPENAQGFRLLNTPDRFTPALFTSLYPVFSVLGNDMAPRLLQNQIAFVHSETRTINLFALDGTNRVKSIKMWPAEANLKCPAWLDIQVAFSPDGKYAYYSNVAGVPYDGRDPSQIDPKWPQGRVYRHDLTKEGSTPEPFFDVKLPDFAVEKYWMPSAWDKKTALSGIDVDPQGNVFVGDLVNHQVVEIGADGKQKSATKVAWPDRVLVSRKTGDLYIVSRKVSRGEIPAARLLKVHGRDDAAKIVAELPLAGSLGGGFHLDERGPQPTVWLAGATKKNPMLWRVADHVDQFEVTRDNLLNSDPNAIGFVGYMDVDAEAELVYVTGNKDTVWRFHGETGAGGLLPIQAVDVAVGPKGDVYAWGTGSYSGPVVRYTRDLKPHPLEATGKHAYGHLYGRMGRGNSVCGFDVDRKGRVYATYGSNECHVRVYDEKGELVDFPRKQRNAIETGKADVPAAITGVTGYGGSLRVDREGNIYLLQQGLEKGTPTPAGFEKDAAFRSGQGTVYKFPPTGGEVKTANGSVKEVIGAIATYAPCGPISRWNAAGSCACLRPRFDVDNFGRLYLSDALNFSVSLRDNADNEILSFGSYGNFDCQGPKSKEPSPAIPLGWPVGVGASDKYIYVGDALNHRVVRVDRKFKLEKTLAID